jgi:Methyltransferase FkbM domain
MLFKQEDVIALLQKHGIKCKGVLHVGAHECQELGFYERIGIAKSNMIWIDALDSMVDIATFRGIPNVYSAVITDKDNETVTFHLASNIMSSSILEFGTHSKNHPAIRMLGTTEKTTTTLDTFLKTHQIDPSGLDFWNFDIQGAELLALKGALGALPYAKVLYMEVNTEEVYKGCALIGNMDAFLESHGFTRVMTDITGAGWGDAIYLKIETVKTHSA